MEEPIITQKRSGVAPLVGTLFSYGIFAVVALILYFGITLYFKRQPDGDYDQKRIKDRLTKLEELQAKNASVLQTVGWVDESASIAHVPIEDGMKLAVAKLAQKKPVASAVAVPAPTPIAAPEAVTSPSPAAPAPAAATSAPAATPAPAASPTTGGAHP